MKRLYKNLILTSITICLISFVIYQAGPKEIYETFLESNKFYLFLAPSLTIAITLAKAQRWKIILKKLDEDISLKAATNYFCVGMYGSTLTPGKVGDLIRAHTLNRREKIGYTKGASSVVMDRLTDLLAVFFLMFFGIFLIFLREEDSIFSDLPIVSVVLAVVAIIIGLFLILDENIGGRVIKKITNKLIKSFKFIEKRTKREGHEFVDEIYDHFERIKGNKVIFGSLIAMSVGIWMLTLFQAHLFLLAFHVNVGLHYIFAFVTLAIVIGLIPITLGGLGTRETAMIYLFALIDVSAAAAGSMSLMLYFFGSIIVAIYGAIYFLKKNIKK